MHSISGRMLRAVDLQKRLEVGKDDMTINYLSAAMMFPNDDGSQLQYLREEAMASAITSHTNASPPPYPFSEHIASCTTNGVLAGTCLMYFHALHSENTFKTKRGNRANASTNIVFHTCESYNLGRNKRSIGRHSQYPTVTKGFVRDIWQTYQRVSHLWAAYLHLRRVPIAEQTFEDALQEIDVSVLLFVARQYERFIVEFFNGKKVGHVSRELIVPFKVRYYDWNRDDTLAITIPDKPAYILESLMKATQDYEAEK